MQLQAQNEVIEQQRGRIRDLESSVRQLEERCSDLRGVAAGHEARAKEAAQEVAKANQAVERLEVRRGRGCFASTS